jgi:hypothetical protein
MRSSDQQLATPWVPRSNHQMDVRRESHSSPLMAVLLGDQRGGAKAQHSVRGWEILAVERTGHSLALLFALTAAAMLKGAKACERAL